MTPNQSAAGLNSGLSSNNWWLRSANHVKFIEGMCDVYVEACFRKKSFHMS